MTQTDNVSVVAQKLNACLATEILENTRSELRGLETRCPLGTFGSKDNSLKRAAAVLEHVARENGGPKLSMTELAKAAAIRENDFVKFHHQVGNFRQTKTTLKPQSVRSSFPSLAMKLGSHVTDSSGVAARAQRLLRDIATFCQKNPQQLQDMMRLHKTYEAAAFYIIATQDTTDETEENHLRASTVVDISTDFTLNEFASVEQHIRDLVKDMHATDFVKGNAELKLIEASQSQRKRKGETAMEASCTSLKTNSRRNTRQTQNTAESLIKKVRDQVDVLNKSFTEDIVQREGTVPQYMPMAVRSTRTKFMTWKDHILHQAIEAAERYLAKNAEEVSNAITRDEVLEFAAKSTLESYNLWQDEMV